MNGLIPQVYANYLERSWLERVIILPALILFLAFIFSVWAVLALIVYLPFGKKTKGK